MTKAREKVPSKHCVMTLTHQFRIGGTMKLMLVNCHLKAGRDATDIVQSKNQARVVSHFLSRQCEEMTALAIAVLADMNAEKKYRVTTAQDAMGLLSDLETASPLEGIAVVSATPLTEPASGSAIHTHTRAVHEPLEPMSRWFPHSSQTQLNP